MNERKISDVFVSPRSTSFKCSNCSKGDAENRCSRCTAVKYCSKECQKDHWVKHKTHCNEIKRRTKILAKEAETLRQFYELEDLLPGSLFKVAIGIFWRLVEPRNYCKERLGLALKLRSCGMKNNSKLALELSVEHMLDLIWLCRGDNLGVRLHIPSILCVLGEVQEAYDFLKWWQDRDLISCCYDMKLPYCNLKGEDMYESLSELKLSNHTDVHWYVDLFLIKYKLIRQLKLDKASYDAFLLGTDPKLGEDSPVMKLSGVWLALENIKEAIAPGMDKRIQTLAIQLVALGKHIDKVNKFIIPGLLNSSVLLGQQTPQYVAAGTQNEAWNIVDYEHLNWKATPNVLYFLKKLYIGMHGKRQALKNIKELPLMSVCYCCQCGCSDDESSDEEDMDDHEE
ncbi:uncharacterized protein [Clytia hemisphaerica]|uniref:MYND-type domain-containing protein n=1 Tax=Clytia hemisphaerica TaxID=252671 RepID=A0A7M5UPA3_9CNID